MLPYMLQRSAKFYIAFLLGFGLLGAPSPSRAGTLSLSVGRQIEVLIVKGAELSSLLGLPVSRIGLFALRGGKLEPIPFQIDQVDDEGNYIFEHWADPELKARYRRQLEGPALLDENDELVFHYADAGLRASRRKWPAGRTGALELDLTDPLRGRKLYVYLFSFKTPAPRSGEDYISYAYGLERVVSRHYELRFCKKAPISVDVFKIKPEAGGRNADIMDRFKVRIEAEAIKGLIKINLNEEDMDSRVLAWTDGPIRVIRRVENSLSIKPLPKIGIEADFIFYDYLNDIPIIVDIPFMLSLFLSKLDLRLYFDMDGAREMTFFTQAYPEGIPMTGPKPIDSWEEFEFGKEPWIMLSGDEGHLFGRVVLDESLPLTLKPMLINNPGVPDPPESFPGNAPAMGLNIRGWRDVGTDRHELAVKIAMLPSEPRGGGSAVYRDMLHPVRVKALAAPPITLAAVRVGDLPPYASDLAALTKELARRHAGSQAPAIKDIALVPRGAWDAGGLEREVRRKLPLIEGCDAVVFLGGEAAAALREKLAKYGTPSFFLAATEPPGFAGGAEKLPGESWRVSAEKILALAAQVKPGAKVVGLPRSGLPGAAAQAAEVRSAAGKAGLTVQEEVIANPKNIEKRMEDLIGRSDFLVFLPEPFWGYDDFAYLRRALAVAHRLKKAPPFSSLRSFAEAGAVMAIHPSGELDVKALADLAEAALRGETPARTVIRRGEQVLYYTNIDAVRRYGISLPPALLPFLQRVRYRPGFEPKDD